MGVNRNMLGVLEKELHNSVSIHRAAMAHLLRRQCGRPGRGEQGLTEERPRSDIDLEETYQNADSLNVMDKLVW